ncbi:MAG: oligosaccharide flippase family protein, partial [Gammaproteobacteria bacterium]
ILARFLTIEEFSIFVQLQNLFTFIIFVSSFSFGEYIVKYVSGHEPNLETNVLITKAASYSLLGIGLIYLLITILSFLGLKLSALNNLDLIFVGIFLTLALIKNIADLFGSAFQGLQKLYIKNIYLDLFTSLLFGFLLMLLLIFKESSDSLLSGKIIALIYFLCLILPTFLLPKPFNFSVLINRKLNKVNKDSINKMFIFSTPLYLSGYLAWLLNLMPLIIAQFSSNDVVSYYVLSISLTVFIFMIVATIDISAFSAWSKKLSDNKVIYHLLYLQSYV